MAIKRGATAIWYGNGKEGKGILTSDSSVLSETQYSYNTRFENGFGTNPEELIASAHAGCFSMKLAFNFQESGISPEEIRTECSVILDNGKISESHLSLHVKAPGVEESEIKKLAEDAKENCPVSQVLAAKIFLEIH